MKKYISIAILLALVSLLSQSAYSQDFPYHLYLTRTLSELVDMDKAEAGKDFGEGKGRMIIHAKPFYSAIRVEYLGEAKDIAKHEQEYLEIWRTSLGYDAELLKLYEKKYLFRECGKDYWIPVQKQVASYFAKELKEGDRITLFLMYPGGIRQATDTEWSMLFLVNEYKKY